MITDFVEIDHIELIKYRREVQYWEREYTRLSEHTINWQKEIKELTDAVYQRDIVIMEQNQQIKALKAELINLKRQIFGRKSEQSESQPLDKNINGAGVSNFTTSMTGTNSCIEKRNRGKQKGAKGHGRKLRVNLPFVEQIHELPPEKCHCPICNSPFTILSGTEDSEEIEWDVIVRRKRHKRVRYISSCNCGAVKGIITASPPAKLIPKGLFAPSFWCNLILEKFLFQKPLYRIQKSLALEGLDVSCGTLIGGLEKIGTLLQPFYAKILEHGCLANHWKMDETRWMVFAEVEGKVGHCWWLWVAITVDTVVYILDPSRSAKVPKNYLGDNPNGIINADRFSVYKALGEKVSVAFCWSHVRRDFIKIGDGYKSLHVWADVWIKRINEIFHQNKKRILALASSQEDFQREDKILRDAINDMAEIRDREINDNILHDAAKKVLRSLKKHWNGCVLFVDNPHIPMDNNESERMLRNPVVGRKNYYGSGSVWSGTLTVILFTILQTLIKNNIDPKKWLLSYFDACAKNEGCPPKDIDVFLPWNFSQEQKLAYCYKEHSP